MASDTTTNTTTSPRGALMAQLLEKHKSAFVSLKKGESVKARITKLTSGEILVSMGAKTDAYVLEKDKKILSNILSKFKVGDEVEVNVLNPESDKGQPIVSLRRYLGQIAWKKLEELQKSKEQIEVKVAEAAKAGYVVDTNFGISGFLPNSHTSQTLAVGEAVKATVLEFNREDNKIIFSQKPTMTEEQLLEVMKKFKVGQAVQGTISNVVPFGIFVSLQPGVEGFIHISEVSWDKVDNLSDTFNSGDKVETVITKFDRETRKISLSLKRLTLDPFDKLVEDFPVDKKVSATVLRVEEAGVALSFEGVGEDAKDVEGYIKKEKIPPTVTYTVDQKVEVVVSEHDKRRHRVYLTPVLKEKPLGYR